MARNLVTACLAVAILAVLTGSAAAGANTFSKGVMVHQAAAPVPTPSGTTSCKDVCTDKCEDVNRDVCEDVQKPFEFCRDVPVDGFEQQCRNFCTNMPEGGDDDAPTPAPEPTNYKSVTLSFGKGGLTWGKGRRLMTGKGFTFGSGIQIYQGWNALSNILNCRVQCRDVPVTNYENRCETRTRTDQECRTVTEQSCKPVCKQVCKQAAADDHQQQQQRQQQQPQAARPLRGQSKGNVIGKGIAIGKGH